MDKGFFMNLKENMKLTNWVSPDYSRLPDFIIGGAMKSGTTTLHTILNTHPKVFIPKDEIHFFDIDNIFQHNDFNFYDKVNDKWLSQDMIENPSRMWDWYLSKFNEKEKFIKGEDSTTYLASGIAAQRIALQKKDIKLIFLLRHPTKRAYSQYYHLLRSGRATYSFEDTIKFNPSSILTRSLYKEQLETYYKYIPKERIKVVLFEDLVRDTETIIEEVCQFLKIDFNMLDKDVFSIHSNKSMLPISPKLQVIFNRFLGECRNTRYIKALPNICSVNNLKTPIYTKFINRSHQIINQKIERKPARMKDSTKQFLDKYFSRELSGLDELVGEEILDKWFDN